MSVSIINQKIAAKTKQYKPINDLREKRIIKKIIS